MGAQGSLSKAAIALAAVLAVTIVPAGAVTARRHRAGVKPKPTVTVAGATVLPAQGAPLATVRVTPGDSPHIKAYAGIFKDNTVAVIDVVTDRVLSTIAVPTGPHGMAITRDGTRVFVSSDGSTVVSVIDTRTDKVTETIDVGAAPHGMALTPDGRMLLVAVFDAGQVVFIDTSSDTVVGRVAVASPHNIAIAPNGASAYVASQKSGSTALVLLDLARRAVIGTVALDKTPRALSFSPDGHELYFTLAGSSDVQVLDPSTDRTTARIGVGASPHHPTFTPDGRVGLVVSQTTGELAILRPGDNTVAATIAVGKLPHWIATTTDSSTALVTDEGSNSVDVIDLRNDSIRASIAVGNGPRKIVVQPGALAPASPAATSAAVPPATTTAVPPATTTAPTAPTPTPTGVAATLGPSVSIAGFAFSPGALTVPAGTTVLWANNDTVPHTVTGSGFGSGDLANGATFRHTFATPGTYAYRCSIHPSMTATVTVTG